MNIDPSEQAQEQEEQQTTTVAATESVTVEPETSATTPPAAAAAALALLISPSSPSSASTVSPTASSISKNSSTDEVDETTAEAEQHPEEAVCSAESVVTATASTAAPHRGEDEQQPQLKTAQQLELEQRADEDDVHHNNSPVRQQQHGERSPTELAGAGPNATMTLEATDTLAQNVTTDLRTPDTDAPATVPVPEGARTEDECDSAKEDGAAGEALSTQELTAEALSPKTPPSLSASSSSSSSSTPSTPSVSEEQRLPAVPEEDTIAADEEYLSRAEGEETLTVSNNNPALLEVELTAPVLVDDAGSSGCINDHYNNNNNNNNNNDDDISKGSDSDFQIVGDISSSSSNTTHTQDSERAEDGGDSETATLLSSPASRTDLEEGVQTSAAAPATEIALGQGEQRRGCVAPGEGGDECTTATCQRAGCDCEHLGSRVDVSQQPPSPPPLLGKAAGSSADEEEEEVANETNDDNNCELSVAPIEIVQTEPLPSDASSTVQRQGDLITTADVVAVAEVDQQNGDERQQQEEANEGDELTAARSEENETCASRSDATDTTVDASPSSSSSSSSSTTTTSAPSPSPPSSSSVSSSSSSEPSPEVVLAGSQQEPSGKGDDGDDDASQLVGDNRPLGDGSPKGHSLEDGEGFPAVTHHRTPPALRTVDADAAVVPQSCSEDDECPSIGSGRHRQVTTTGTRLLTLAEELSQAGAAAEPSSLYATVAAPSLAASAPPPSTVVDVLPKSAAGTAAAVVSGSSSSRSTSPVLHSSLKKPSKRMVVATGAGTVAAAAAAAVETAKGENTRRVSFPKDAQLITGYLEPVNPWSCISICETTELLELYRSSCKRHNTVPLQSVLEHLQSLDATKDRVPLLSLRDQHLTYGGCEALEEIFKHVQYRCIDLSHSGLNDVTASVMFDIIEYYEAATELDISDNLQMSSKSWTACINMLKKSQALNVLITRGPTISDYQANNLAKALNASAIHTLKLEHCVLSQQPIASLCNVLKRNEVLRELWLAHNQLNCEDAQQIANLLRSNFYIQLIDISNNRIGDKGVEHIVNAIVEQAVYFKDVQDKKRKSDLNFSDLSSSLNNINNSAKNYFPHQRLRSSDSESMPAGAEADEDKSPSPLTLTPPVTPPSTPALPTTCETGTEETKQVAQPQASNDKQLEPTNGDATCAVAAPTVYTMQQQQSNNDETNPPLLPPSSPSASSTSSSPLTLPTLGAVAPSNVELVEMSTKHSVSLQTTSDREKLDAVAARPAMMTAEEEALMNSSSGGATATVEAVALVTAQETGEQALSDGDGESRTMSTSAETVQTDRSESTVVVREASNGGAEEELPGKDLDKHSESPVPQAPKKPRLAKQDSVLTEFEASIATAMETGEDGEGLTEQKPKNKLSGGEGVTIPSVIEEQPSSASVMEEDVPELCADYDDDGSNFRISQENLFVELGIPALSEQEERLEADSGAPDSPGDVFPPLVAVPSKKDELQLLIEKSKQSATGEAVADRLEQPAVPATPQKTLGGDRERKSAISSDERPVAAAAAAVPAATTKKNRTQSSSSDSYVPSAERAIQMVNVEIKDSVPLSRSLDSVGGESESDFESSSPFRTTAPGPFPNERSFSSESLNSETSIDSNDSKSSLKIHESKFAAKNGTLERQQSNRVLNRDAAGAEQAAANPGGLQVLVLWNNEMTRSSARHFQRLLEKTSTLDTLNVGSNQLCNSFVAGISGSLKANTTLTNLGLQGAHLSDKGVKTMAEIIEFGGNSSLQRIDLRHNNIQKAGLEALNEAMKSNKSVTRIDLDDTPRRIKDTSLDGVGSEYSRLVNNIRAQCERNKNPPEPSEPISTTVRRARANYLSSRKISLTCPSIKTSPSAIADKQHLLDPNGGCKKSTGGRLRSPLPSPIPSPAASPVPSPSRNRFHVSRVSDSGGGGAGGTASSPSPSSTGSSPTLFFPSNSRFRVVTVAEPDSAKSANGNPYRSSSTISLPMSKSSASSFAMGGTSCAGTMAPSAGTINRRPVCSSAPTLSSFPPSPLSPLAAGGPVGGRVAVASQTPSPLLPPSYSTGYHSTGFQTTTMLPSPLLTAGSSPTMPGGLVPIVANTATMPLGIPQTLLQQQQQQHQQLQPQPHYQPQFVPMMPQQQQQPQPNYHFITTFGPGNSTSIPLQPMITQIQKYPNLTEPLVTLPPQHPIQQQQPLQLQHPQQQQQQQQQILPQTPSSYTGKGRQHSCESPHQHQHSSSNTSSTTLHDSVLSSTSIESPDLEVKRFMSGGALRDDSCCSSISSNSIESIDNAHFNLNTSISSTDESFDLIVNSPPPVTTSAIASSSFVQLPAGGTVSCSSEVSPNVSSISRIPEEESTLIPRQSASCGGEPPKATLDAPASFSSSSMVHVPLASSQESLYDVHDLSGSSNSSTAAVANLAPTGKLQPPPPTVTALPPVPTTFSGGSVLPMPNTTGAAPGVATLSAGGNNSNESTLTSVQNLEREPTVTKPASHSEKPPRVRKTSWILGGSGSSHKHADSSSSGGSTPTPGGGGSGYPPAIEKLLSIFHPSNLFSSSKASSASSASPPPSAAQDGSQPPSRKESPMGGLFYWAHHGAGSGNSSNTSANTSPTSAGKKEADRAAALKVNVSPETTLTPQQLQPLQNQAQVMAQLQSSSSHPQQQQHSAERMPRQLKVEMKENISPENTITNKLLLSSNAPAAGVDVSTVLIAPSSPAPAAAPIVNVAPATTAYAKVIFQLGGDYDESEDDIDTLTSRYGNHPGLGGGGGGQSGPSSLLGGSTTSNSSGISIGSGTSAGEMMSGSGGMLAVSPSPSTTSGQSATSDTVVVLSHLGQLARDSLSMFKNPSLTSQDSISIRSMDSLTEIGGDTKTAAGRKDASPVVAVTATVVAPPQPPTSTASSSSTPLASASAAAPLVADIQFETR